MSDLLSITELVSGYRSVKVLQSIGFSVGHSGITAIIGPNGHGKSTLLNTIAGLLPAWSGEIMFDGAQLPKGAPERARLGLTLVPQGDKLFTGMTVEENLMMGAFARHDPRAIRDTLERVFDLFPRLKERRGQRAESLSGGERRMVGIGRGLMADGKLVMIDEPSLGLAPLIIEQIYEALAQIAAEGRAIIVVEENPSRVAKVADRFHLMDGGAFAWSGTTAELETSGEIIKTYLGA